MTIRTRLTNLERAAAASMLDGDILEVTEEQFIALPDETKLGYLRGTVRLRLPPLPPEQRFQGTFEEWRLHMATVMADCGLPMDAPSVCTP